MGAVDLGPAHLVVAQQMLSDIPAMYRGIPKDDTVPSLPMVAFHEAAHAVVAMELNLEVQYAWATAERGGCGIRWPAWSNRYLAPQQAAVAWAGLIGEVLATGESLETRFQRWWQRAGDAQQITDLLDTHPLAAEAGLLMAAGILSQVPDALNDLARELIGKRGRGELWFTVKPKGWTRGGQA